MRSGRAQGYAILTEPDRPTKENDTFTCKHCGAIVFVKPAADPVTYGGWCGRCNALICQACEEKKVKALTCTPLEKWLERQEARGRTLRSLGLG